MTQKSYTYAHDVLEPLPVSEATNGKLSVSSTFLVCDEAGRIVADCTPHLDVPEISITPEEATQYARRIVACVNACVGVPTDHLESDYYQGYEPWGHVEHLKKENDTLKAQRDELLESLKEVIGYVHGDIGRRGIKALDKAEKAITNATKEPS